MMLKVLTSICLAVWSVSAQQPVYGQCGGIGWTGGTTCVSGATCTVVNAYYYQCLPSTSSTTTTTTTTKTSTSSSSSTSHSTSSTSSSSVSSGSFPVTVNPAPPGYTQYTSPVVEPARPVSGDGAWASAVARAKTFVAGLSLQEKVNLTTGVGTGGRCVGNTGTIPRLNFAGICLQDGPLGVRYADLVSAFPAGINTAATWDVDLIQARGAAMGAEFRGKGVNVALGPVAGLGRVPEGGRNWEGFGADPFLAGVATYQTVTGIQSQGVIATAKHYINNEQEQLRGSESSDLDDRSMHELYLWPFAEAVRAGVGSVMCSYNRINQTYSCENSKVINGLLKEELDFQGFVVSDWTAFVTGVYPALAGSDMNMPGFIVYGNPSEGNPDNTKNSYWGSALITAVNNGSVPQSRVDDMVTRTMAAYYKMGQDSGYPAVNFNYNNINDGSTNSHVNVQGNHSAVIRQIDAASVILLKNTNNALPLNVKSISKYALVGTDAVNNPSGINSCSDRGCDTGHLAMGWGSGTANFPYLVDPQTAITNYVKANNSAASITTVNSDSSTNSAISSAVGGAGACLVFVTADSGEGYITVEGNPGDRTSLSLWHGGDALILAVANTCKNTIVVLNTVGSVLMEQWINHANVTGVLLAGIAGQESGNGLVDVLFGDVNPSGKLPYTIGKQLSDYPAQLVTSSSANPPQVVYSEGLFIDYRWFDKQNIAPRFEFGFGLSYTTFAYSSLNIASLLSKKDVSNSNPGGPASLYNTAITVTFTVANNGTRSGQEVSQVYLSYPASLNEPPRVLRGFAKTAINAGASASVSVALTNKDISYWDVLSQNWLISTGTYTISVGGSSRNLPLTATFTV